ncbi:MAG: S1 RNA-binding domain-containing protein, partial [Synechococcaceae cyanobacterium]|nr:S1 RNA-binding domain-containing protein [Synechococcaceae cyanobacterium]
MIRKEEPAAPPAEPETPSVAPTAMAPAPALPVQPAAAPSRPSIADDEDGMAGLAGLTMADLLGPEESPRRRSGGRSEARPAAGPGPGGAPLQRSVDDFDFDEEAFLAALDENEPVGATGEVVSGVVIGVESDGVYVDIGGKAPGFMPKKEAGLGVITNLKERFPKGLPVEVLVTREQNADGMVTISARALALRQSW